MLPNTAAGRKETRPNRGALSQSIVDAVAELIVVLDGQGVIIMTNRSWDRFARENQSETPDRGGVGVNYLEICRAASGESSQDAKEVLAGLERVLSGAEQYFEFEYPCHAPTAQRWFRVKAYQLERSGGGAVLVHVDVTARKDLEREVRQHEERFRLALENSPVVVFNQDRELRYTWINSPVMQWAEQDYLGRTDMEILGGSEGQWLTAIKRAVIDTGVKTRLETSVTFQGEVRHFDLNVAPLRGQDGTVQGITCACTDITSIKRAAAEREMLLEELANSQRELVRRNLELQSLNEEKTRWLGVAGHDLRNPLAAILANCDLLADQLGADPSENMEIVKSIQSSGKFMLELLDHVLGFWALETGTERFSPEWTDLGQCVKEILALLRPLAEKRDLRIEEEFPEQLPQLAVDRLKVSQVLLNVIANAIKFSPDGTRIQIRVAQESESVHISVRDHGPGIRPEDLRSIFRVFHRAARAPSGPEGTGLGLAISKRIVERHGGRIWAENAIGGGAVLHLTLPVTGSGRFSS
jgi:PAS domain S-box-containing protein